MKYFTASRFENGCRNNNLMNSKIVIFACNYLRSLKNYDILENKIYHEEEKITWNFLLQAILERDVGIVIDE